MGQINTNNYPTVESLADADLLIVENLTNGTGTTTPKQLKENAIGTDPLQTTSQTVTGAINELKSRIDGGGSYSAGAGINIANNVITNIRRGALPGVIDEITSGGYAHTQINNALDSITAGGLVVLKAETSGTANTVRIQYGEQASQSQAYRLCDTDLEYATINVSVGDTIILMFDDSGYRLIVLSVLSNSGGGSGDSYAGLGVGKMVSFTSNVIDTDIDLHRAPMAGDRLLIWFNTTIQNPTSLTTYNNGTAVTSNLETVSPLLYNAGWNVVEFMNDGLLYNNVWVRKQNVPIPNNTLSGLDDTAISVNPTDGQVLTYNGTSGRWENKNPSGDNSMSKTRYTISSSSWSASANASGYYTYSLTLTTLLSTSYAPNVYISGASDSTFSTDTEKAQFSYLDECNLSASNTLVLYAKTKPTSTFYVYVEGQNA